MISIKSQMVKAWLIQKLKHAPAAKTVQEGRERLAKLAGSLVVEGVTVEPVNENGVRGEWVSAGNVAADKVILYFHGGAFIMGSLQVSRELARVLSQAANCRVLSVDYRLAPEHPYPAALEDAAAAYRWLTGSGILPEHIVFAGESAGGGLALSALTLLRDAGEKLPAGAVLMTPWLDLLGTGESSKTKQEVDPWYHPESIELQAGRLYAGSHNITDPRISPLYADLSGLPPLLLHAAGDDVLMDDSTRLYKKWQGKGVDITLEVWDGMWHVWHYFAGKLPEARQAVEKIGRFVKDRTGA